MKKFLGFAAILLVSATVFASGKSAPSSDGYGTPKCAAFDSGSTEEHGGHASCESCLSSHGGCDMKCFDYDYTCTASKNVDKEVTVKDPFTGKLTVELRVAKETNSASGRTKDEARNNALRDCEYNGGRWERRAAYSFASCTVSCSESSYETSSQSCRK